MDTKELKNGTPGPEINKASMALIIFSQIKMMLETEANLKECYEVFFNIDYQAGTFKSICKGLNGNNEMIRMTSKDRSLAEAGGGLDALMTGLKGKIEFDVMDKIEFIIDFKNNTNQATAFYQRGGEKLKKTEKNLF